jgi:hypothetical protein
VSFSFHVHAIFPVREELLLKAMQSTTQLLTQNIPKMSGSQINEIGGH